MAFGLFLVLSRIHPRHLQRHTPALFTIGVLLLIAVILVGDTGKGAQRWLNLGFMRFQPSEILKITTPMMIAWLIAEHPLPVNWKQLLFGCILIMIPTALIAVQPDLGTALLVASSGLAVLFMAGLSWRIIFSFMLACIPMTYVLWEYFMKDYQRGRVLTLLNPEADPLGRGYHIIQSKIAIGSGGWYGKGWLNGTQTHLQFLPERSTDFIFAVYAEEFGLYGVIALISIYLFVISRSFMLALQAGNTYGRLLRSSLTITFFVYVFVNIGMVSGILPVVGVPLPLISYGGTSMVTLLAGFGILMSVYSHRQSPSG
jgi:rod shape determining protein RodA